MTSNAIRVRSDYPISVQQFIGLNNKMPIHDSTDLIAVANSEASTLIPNSFYESQFEALLLHSESPVLLNDLFAFSERYANILSLDDGNQIEIMFGQGSVIVNKDTVKYDRRIGEFLTLNIDQKDSYVLHTRDSYTGNGSTGSRSALHDGYIKSTNNKPLKVVLTHTKFNDTIDLPGINFYGGFTFEDPIPLAGLPKSIHVAPLFGHHGSLLAIEAIEDSTIITINNSPPILLNAKERIDSCFTSDLFIHSNKAFYTSLQPCIRRSFNNNFMSPFLVRPLDETQLITATRVKPVPEPTFNNKYYIDISCPISAIGTILLDGQAIPPNAFTPYAFDNTWGHANIPIDTTYHTLSSSVGFQVYQYTAFDTSSTTSFPSYGINLAQDVKVADSVRIIRSGINQHSLFATDTIFICQGEVVYFNPGDANLSTWVWDFPDTSLFAGPKETVSFKFENSGSYTVRRLSTNSCHKHDSVVVVVTDGYPGEINYSFNQNCSEQVLKLWLSSYLKVDSLEWKLPYENRYIDTARYRLSKSQTKSLSVQAFFVYNDCPNTLNLNIDLGELKNQDSVIMPNILTPNGDGLNDELCFQDHFSEYENCFKVIIKNRWGKVMYQSDDINLCWTPSDIPSGVYFYVVRYGQETKEGFIHLN